MLRAGCTPVAEPGLDELLGEGIRTGSVIPVSTTEEAIPHTDIALICVGTPSRTDGTCETVQIRRVLEDVAAALRGHPNPYVIALRSTLPHPQLAAEVLPLLASGPLAERWEKDVFFALNPEFLREGNAIEDFLNPPYLVVGTDHAKAIPVFRELYSGIDAPFVAVSPGTASLLKYACNSFHAMKVAFANEIGALERVFHADGGGVMDMLCEDRILNISPAYLRPGYAFGGSCLPKDLRALTRTAVIHGIPTPLLSAVGPSNESVIARSVDLIGGADRRRIGLVGLSFKSGTDDLRESPLVELAERLLGKGFEIQIFDPEVRLEMLQGRNLRYVEEHIPHLVSLLVEDLEDLVPDDPSKPALIVVGKAIVTAERLIDLCPAGARVLDLVRCLPVDAAPLEVLRI